LHIERKGKDPETKKPIKQRKMKQTIKKLMENNSERIGSVVCFIGLMVMMYMAYKAIWIFY